ncbi:MAG: hypothetical protein BIFFINMI_01385 [Phycisphaerae bacterium]|nr:hypothetical protein [Phycisphaerae bacterium]
MIDSASVARRPQKRWWPWLLAGGLVGVAYLAALRFDLPLMRLRYRHWPDKDYGLLNQAVVGLRNFAQLLTVATACIVAIAYDRRWRRVVLAILIGQGLAIGCYNTLKYFVVRERPYVVHDRVGLDPPVTFRDTFGGVRAGNLKHDLHSFPSGHSAAAFALAGVLAFYYRRLGWLFWFYAVGCALSRYLDAVHWASDCIAGATFGWLCALLVLSVQKGMFGPRVRE